MQQHRPGADLPDADGGVGPCSSTPGGGAGGRRRAGADEALAEGHAEEGPGEGGAEHRSGTTGSRVDRPRRVKKSERGSAAALCWLPAVLPGKTRIGRETELRRPFVSAV